MLMLILACLPNSGAPIDTGAMFPTWSGTQIGEEGDEGCLLEGTDWDDEASAPPGSGLTPAEVRAAMGGEFDGVLVSAWQGETDLIATVTLDGPAQALSDSTFDCPPALGISGTIDLTAGSLLVLQTPLTLTVQDSLGSFAKFLADDALDGDLSPGILPEDAGDLSLLIAGSSTGGGWAGQLDWYLQRSTDTEHAEAASWSAE
jgi:hypothetical protein